jgi:hypothetical protein
MNETFTPPAELNAASQLLSLISLLADRDATKRLLDRLVGASKAALDACEKLGDARAAQAAVEKERQAFVKWMDAERAKLKDEHALLSADKDQLRHDRAGHHAVVAAHAERVAAFEASKQEHAEHLAALDQFKRTVNRSAA